MKIVAIGGGEIGRKKILDDGSVKQYPIETREIDKKIIELSKKYNPKLLFIGTASDDSPEYFQDIKNYFGNEHNCRCSALNVLSRLPFEEIQKAVFNTDIIYVGGGNSDNLVKAWKACGLDKILNESLNRNIILSGLSAGANCWFKYYSTKQRNGYSINKGLGLINGICVPHTLSDPMRHNCIDEAIKHDYCNEIFFAIDDYAALIYDDGNFTSMASNVGLEKNACVKKIVKENGIIKKYNI